MSENVIREKSFRFAVRIVKLYQYLSEEKREFVMSKQLLRSGTSIGANVREALQGQSKADFTAKMSMSLKEAAESEYWLELLYETGYLTQEEYDSIRLDAGEVSRLLTAIVRSVRTKGSP